MGQELDEPFEVILVNSGVDRTVEIVEREFPEVRVVRLPHPALPGRARNAGLRVARGTFVSFPGSHVELPPGSLAARLRAHRLGFPLVTGTMKNGTRTAAGWASYFLDNRTALPSRPSGALPGPPVRCSYLREALLRVGGFPEGFVAAEDTLVNVRLHALGYRAYRSREVVLTHNSVCSTPRILLRHHFRRGRGMARVLAAERGRAYTGLYVAFVVPVRLTVITCDVMRYGRGLRRAYGRVFRWSSVGRSRTGPASALSFSG